MNGKNLALLVHTGKGVKTGWVGSALSFFSTVLFLLFLSTKPLQFLMNMWHKTGNYSMLFLYTPLHLLLIKRIWQHPYSIQNFPWWINFFWIQSERNGWSQICNKHEIQSKHTTLPLYTLIIFLLYLQHLFICKQYCNISW